METIEVGINLSLRVTSGLIIDAEALAQAIQRGIDSHYPINSEREDFAIDSIEVDGELCELE